jgi:hypothetical protein
VTIDDLILKRDCLSRRSYSGVDDSIQDGYEYDLLQADESEYDLLLPLISIRDSVLTKLLLKITNSGLS